MSDKAIAIISSIVALFSGGGLLLTRLRKAFKTMDKLERLIQMVEALEKLVPLVDSIESVISKELEHNHGSSMKDDLHGMAVGFGLTQRQVDDLEDVVTDITSTVTEIQTVLQNHILKGEQ